MENTIVLVGMSGVGKSYHSRKLKRDQGYNIFTIDDMIARELGQGDVHDVANFIGPPYEDKYKENSRVYSDLEERFTKEAIEYAKANQDKKVIIDTTGSVVHLSEEIISLICSFKNVIFLETEDSRIKQMIKQYLTDPKPVMWGELARDFTEENYREKLTHLYPKLLEDRKVKYRSMSTIHIPFQEHKSEKFSIFDWIK